MLPRCRGRALIPTASSDRDPAETAATTTAEEKGAVKYFYCSTRVFQMYGDEGLKDLRMSFEDFAASPFLARELEAVEERSAVCKKVAERTKRKSALQRPTGRLFRFCHQPPK